MRAFLVAAFLGCILAANYVTTEYGMITVLGVGMTAGTFFAGATFVLRDSIQDRVRASLPRRLVVEEEPYVVDIGFGPRTVGSRLTRLELPPRDRDVAVRVIAIIMLGAVLSFAVSAPAIALASGVAFLVGETLDLTIYTPLRRQGYVRAALASNLVGSVVDTVLFLWIAGFPVWGAIAGQVSGKLSVTAVVLAGVLAYRAVRDHRKVVTA